VLGYPCAVSTYAYLGPVGTFTEAALKKITTPTDLRTPYANVTAALDAVRSGDADFALVPIENSVEGVVARMSPPPSMLFEAGMQILHSSLSKIRSRESLLGLLMS